MFLHAYVAVTSGNISPRDCAQLFGKCVEAPTDLDFAIIHGSSDHRQPMMSIEHTKNILGYEPQDGTKFGPTFEKVKRATTAKL